MALLNPVGDVVRILADLPAATLTDEKTLGDVLQRHAEEVAAVCCGLGSPDGTYRRSLLYRTDRFELLLLQWGRGAESSVHDHAGQTCVFTVLDGELTVDDFALAAGERSRDFVPIRQTGTGTVTPGALDARKGAADIHRVSSAGRALSLHIYARPMARCGIYCPQTFTRSSHKLSYDDVRVDLLQPHA
jgi:predicted metal-dependent enzyme (double-stranded beta helix superfamily)